MKNYGLFAGKSKDMRSILFMHFSHYLPNFVHLLQHFLLNIKKRIRFAVPILTLFVLTAAIPTYASPPMELLSFQEGTQVTLAWKAPTDIQIIGYTVYRGTDQNTLTQIAIVGTNIPDEATETPPPTLFTDTSVTVGNSYFYKVKAIDTTGTESVFSAVTATTIYQLVSTLSAPIIQMDSQVRRLLATSMVMAYRTSHWDLQVLILKENTMDK